MAAPGALAQAPEHFLAGCGLPAAWAGKAQWRILETRFGAGLNFLVAWRAWQLDPQRPRMLHYVAIEAAPVEANGILAAAEVTPELRPLADALTRQWVGLTAGFHRLAFGGGKVLLTVCVGDVQAMLREQAFAADTVYLNHAQTLPADPARELAALKAAARCCRRGTAIWAAQASNTARRHLAQCGFQLGAVAQAHPPGEAMGGVFDPAWTMRRAEPTAERAPGAAAVIGGGLAGAAVAASLARRGWQVQVLDTAPVPAAGASGLPAGLLAPHTSPDDNQLSRLTRAGVRMTLQQAHELLMAGVGWQLCGVLAQRPPGDARALPSLGTQGTPWQCLAAALAEPPAHAQPHAVWHALAAWLCPAALVRAWLGQPQVEWRGGCRVDRLLRHEAAWQLLGAQGEVLAQADLVVVAAAMDSAALLPAKRPTLNPVRGQISWALHERDAGHEPGAAPPWPVHAFNGNGHFIPSVPVPGGKAWLCGSTYDRAEVDTAPREADHATNLAHLRELVPALAETLSPAFDSGQVQAWAGVRCTSHDRRPLLGEIEPGLWLTTAMGSRGLTFAALCAELLAAQLHAEPLPLPRALVKALAASRAID